LCSAAWRADFIDAPTRPEQYGTPHAPQSSLAAVVLCVSALVKDNFLTGTKRFRSFIGTSVGHWTRRVSRGPIEVQSMRIRTRGTGRGQERLSKRNNRNNTLCVIRWLHQCFALVLCSRQVRQSNDATQCIFPFIVVPTVTWIIVHNNIYSEFR